MSEDIQCFKEAGDDTMWEYIKEADISNNKELILLHQPINYLCQVCVTLPHHIFPQLHACQLSIPCIS